jgi:hypothetical protein
MTKRALSPVIELVRLAVRLELGNRQGLSKIS